MGKCIAIVRKNETITKHSKAKLKISFCFLFTSNFYYSPTSSTTSYFVVSSAGILMQ